MRSSLAIVAPQAGPRLHYVADVVFRFHFNIEYRIINAEEEAAEGEAVISYFKEFIAKNAFAIPATGFLEEKEITAATPPVSFRNDIPVLFPIPGNSDWGFDVFSAIFWCLSRYEEYLAHEKDEHGRFQPHSSLAYQQGFLQIPVVDIWINLLREKLLDRFPNLPLAKRQPAFVPTIDIDQAYSYKGKGIARTAGATLRELAKAPRNVVQRWQVLSGQKEDPFDNFEYLEQQFEKYNVPPIFFILVGKHGPFDKNLEPQRKFMRQLVSRLAKYNIGLHPSYRSNDQPELLAEEKQQLEELLQRPMQMSRQHFLRLSFPETYRRLLDVGITEDYTMGYAAETGFRAGTTQPFPFYDLEKETQTGLVIHPFCTMEVTLKHYLNLPPKEAMQRMQQLVKEVQKVGGTFISIWHNETLHETGLWNGWRKVFETMLAEGTGLNNHQ